jgi:integrase/recombinase XerD
MMSVSNPGEFASLLQRFFMDRLIRQKNASPQTVAAYRDTFKLLLQYSEQQLKKRPAAFVLNDFDAKLVLCFLDYLESERKNSVRSRNARLAAIHSFANFVSLQHPQALHQIQQILAIPMKRYDQPLLGFLSKDEVEALLAAPDTRTWCGQRDRIMLAVLYNTGARVSELINVSVADVTFEGSASIKLRGKGRKQRTLPLWRQTAREIRDWVKRQSLQADDPLVPSRLGCRMTRSNVCARLALAVKVVAEAYPRLQQCKITPHILRHSIAMHMLQSGVNITVIALWLGHESPTTTHRYVEADLAMKERALNSVNQPIAKKTRYQAPDALLRFLDGL